MADVTKPLFSWDAVDARSDLDRFYLVQAHLPDEEIIAALEAKRGHGRDDFPVRAMWNALLAGIVFQHPSGESLLRELQRNPALLEACGFDPLPRQKAPVVELVRDEPSGRLRAVYLPAPAPEYAAPSSWNLSRFLLNVIELEEQQGLIQAMVVTLREQLMVLLPDFGRHLGFDGKAIHRHSTGQVNQKTEQRSDPDADWGKHETRGIDANGKPWRKIKSWFGYGLHLIADTQYELPVAFHLTPASHAEQGECRALIEETFAQTPELAERCQDFSADRGLDCAETKARLWDAYQIRPLIDTRELWREEKQAPDYDPSVPITRPLYPERADTIVHTEKGTVHCVCPVSGAQRDLAFQGFEAERNTLKYRCPAAAYGFDCSGQTLCHQAGDVQPGEYGRIVRINITEQDRRVFVPTPHGSPRWQRGYKRRTPLERINNRIDHSFGFELHFIRGKAKMMTHVGLALAVMMALAVGHINAGRPEQMRSLVRPIAPCG